MVHPAQMHELVNEDVVAHRGRHQDEPPIQTDVPVAAAGTPARALVADADARDGEPVLRRKRQQPRRQLAASPIAQRRPVLDRRSLLRNTRALPRDPFLVALRELLRLAA